MGCMRYSAPAAGETVPQTVELVCTEKLTSHFTAPSQVREVAQLVGGELELLQFMKSS